jgi:hypothetical protein
MAERTKIDRKVDQRDVHRYTPRMSVVARPVDTFDRAAGLSNDAQRLSQALGGVVQASAGIGSAIQAQNRRAAQEGVRMAEQGEDAPEATDSVFSTANIARKAFMETRADRKAAEMVPLIAQASIEAENEGDFVQRVTDLAQNTVDDFNGDLDFFDRFQPQMDDMVGRAFAQNLPKWNAKRQAVELRNQAGAVQSQIRSTFEQHFSGGKTLEELKRSPAEYARFKAELAKGSLDLGQMIRGRLTELQKRNEIIGLDKDQMSQWMIKQLTTIAVDYGVPEVFEFANIEDSGVSLADRYSAEIGAAKRQAVLAEKAIEREAVVKRDERRDTLRFALHDQLYQFYADLREADSDSEKVAISERIQETLNSDDARELFMLDPASVTPVMKLYGALSEARSTPDGKVWLQSLQDVYNGSRSWEDVLFDSTTMMKLTPSQQASVRAHAQSDREDGAAAARVEATERRKAFLRNLQDPDLMQSALTLQGLPQVKYRLLQIDKEIKVNYDKQVGYLTSQWMADPKNKGRVMPQSVLEEIHTKAYGESSKAIEGHLEALREVVSKDNGEEEDEGADFPKWVADTLFFWRDDEDTDEPDEFDDELEELE